MILWVSDERYGKVLTCGQVPALLLNLLSAPLQSISLSSSLFHFKHRPLAPAPALLPLMLAVARRLAASCLQFPLNGNSQDSTLGLFHSSCDAFKNFLEWSWKIWTYEANKDPSSLLQENLSPCMLFYSIGIMCISADFYELFSTWYIHVYIYIYIYATHI